MRLALKSIASVINGRGIGQTRLKKKGKLSIFTICDDSKEIAESATLVKRCMRFIAVKLYSGIILTNDDVLSWYVERFQTRQKFLFFPIIQKDQDFRLLLENALPVSRILKDTYHLEGRQVLLFVGRLIDIKNLFFLLDAFALVVKRYPKAILLFVGDGDQREALERHAERNGLANHVIFAGKKQGFLSGMYSVPWEERIVWSVS